MKWVLMTPETLIHPRAISSTHNAYVSSDSPRPSYSSGIISPKMPSSLRPSTISCGYSSACSSSVATGRISFSTKLRTALRISVWSSVRPSVSHSRPTVAPSQVTRSLGRPGRSVVLPGGAGVRERERHGAAVDVPDRTRPVLPDELPVPDVLLEHAVAVQLEDLVVAAQAGVLVVARPGDHEAGGGVLGVVAGDQQHLLVGVEVDRAVVVGVVAVGVRRHVAALGAHPQLAAHGVPALAVLHLHVAPGGVHVAQLLGDVGAAAVAPGVHVHPHDGVVVLVAGAAGGALAVDPVQDGHERVVVGPEVRVRRRLQDVRAPDVAREPQRVSGLVLAHLAEE